LKDSLYLSQEKPRGLKAEETVLFARKNYTWEERVSSGLIRQVILYEVKGQGREGEEKTKAPTK